jgi:hypothetical protein
MTKLTIGRHLTSALKDRKVDVNEARRIVAEAKKGGVSAEEKAEVQRTLNQWADRFTPRAEAEVRKLAGKNAAGTVRAQLRDAAKDGQVNLQDMAKIRKTLVQDGFTGAERRELDRGVAGMKDKFTDSAYGSYEQLRVSKGDFVSNPFNQKFPGRVGDAGNRLRNNDTGKQLFPIKSGTHLFDGAGGDRGRVAAGSVKINFGQRKDINGEPHVYAFATTVKDGKVGANGKDAMGASGWIKESALKDGPLKQMPTVDAPRPLKGDLPGEYKITGGSANRFGDLKVVPNSKARNERASDYLLRPGNVTNLLYNLPGQGGVSTDTLPKGAPFVRAAGVEPVKIPLYRKGDDKVADHMTFVYGRSGDRYGWIAQDALKKA